jgi:hypothetical protein
MNVKRDLYVVYDYSKLSIAKKKVLQKVFGSIYNLETGTYERRGGMPCEIYMENQIYYHTIVLQNQ